MYSAVELRKMYIIYIRAVLSLAILLIAVYNSEAFVSSMTTSVIYLALVLGSNFVFLYVPQDKFKGVRLHYIVFIVDLAIIVLGAYVFTQLNLNFLLAIFLTIFMSALSQSVGLSLVIAIVVNAVYIYMKYLTTPGYMIFEDTAFLNIPFIFIVALHGSYLAEKANQDTREKYELEKIGRFLSKKVQAVNQEMSSVADFMDRVMQSFKFGIIIIDEDGFIRVFNQKSEHLLNVKSSRAEGTALKDSDFLGGIKDLIMDLKFKKQEAFEKTAVVQVSGKEKTYKVTVSAIINRAQEDMGVLCVIKET